MRRLPSGLVDRRAWPSRAEINDYVDPGYAGSSPFKARVFNALIAAHAVADAYDTKVLAGTDAARCTKLELALAHYASEDMYGKWGRSDDPQQHWVFGSLKGFSQFNLFDEDRKPWTVAQEALAGVA